VLAVIVLRPDYITGLHKNSCICMGR